MVLILAISSVDKCFDVRHKLEAKKVIHIQETPKLRIKTNKGSDKGVNI